METCSEKSGCDLLRPSLNVTMARVWGKGLETLGRYKN